MAVLETTQFEQLVTEVKQQLLAESQGVGEVEVVSSLAGINSLPALRGDTVVEAPIELLERPATEAAERAEQAAKDALDTANHPTYIGSDNYVYVWDKTTQAYNKTSIYVRGEPFSIRKVYASVDEMYVDTSTPFKEGDFCLINTGSVEDEETAQLFVRTAAAEWEFVVDMSGAVGFTGKTPQIEVGTVAVGVGRNDAGVTLSDNGVDEEGNPKYLLNIRIPSIQLDDLTEEEIAELQSPANDMIAQLQETEDGVKEAEALRASAEDWRAEEFARLKSESETAASNANAAAEGASAARDEANKASQNAIESADNADKAAAGANSAAVSARTAATEANTARDAANAAAQKADEAAGNADVSAKNADEAAEDAAEAATGANSAASNASTAADSANTAADVANRSAATANEAADAANTAALKAGNLPIIQDGTWWLYDVDSDSYVDSGYAVSSDFQLTKEKIENVFTGNIVSHWHGRYVDKVEGKQLSTEDFTTILKEKLDGLSNYDDTEISQAVEELRSDFDELVSGDTTTAIETFNEVIGFLDGLKDTENLASIIASIEQQIAAKGTVTSITAGSGLTGGTITGEGTIALEELHSSNKSITFLPFEETGLFIGSSLALNKVPVTNVRTLYSIGCDKNGRITDLSRTSLTESRTHYNIEEATTSLAGFMSAEDKTKLDGIDMTSKQDNLVSGTNIKTINGTSILGSGDITIETGLSESEVDNRIAEAITTVLNTEV